MVLSEMDNLYLKIIMKTLGKTDINVEDVKRFSKECDNGTNYTWIFFDGKMIGYIKLEVGLSKDDYKNDTFSATLTYYPILNYPKGGTHEPKGDFVK